MRLFLLRCACTLVTCRSWLTLSSCPLEGLVPFLPRMSLFFQGCFAYSAFPGVGRASDIQMAGAFFPAAEILVFVWSKAVKFCILSPFSQIAVFSHPWVPSPHKLCAQYHREFDHHIEDQIRYMKTSSICMYVLPPSLVQHQLIPANQGQSRQ